MANSDWIVKLEAVIDNSSLTNAQKKIAKEHFKADLDIQLDIDKFASQKKQVSKSVNELATEMKTAFSKIDIDISDKQANSFAREFLENIRQSTKEQEKLNKLQKKNNLVTQEKYYQRIIDNNKTIYSLKEKLIRADEKQSQEIQNQITKLEKRNQYNYGQLNKKGLTDNSWEWEVNTSKEVLENRLRINQEKQKDVALSKQIADIDKINRSLSVGDYNVEVSTLTSKFQKWGLSVEEVENKMHALNTAYVNLSKKDLTNDQRIKAEKEYQLALEKTNNELKLMSLNSASRTDRTNLSNKIQVWLDKNTKASEKARKTLQEYIVTLNKSDDIGVPALKNIKNEFAKIEIAERSAGRLGKSFTDTLKAGVRKFTEWGLASNAVMTIVSNLKKATTELKEIDTYLTEISKANDKLSKSDLAKIGDNSFDVASKYGKKSTDYLSAVQESSRAGYENAEAIAKLSTAIQGAGDVTADTANAYVIATDKAYELKGSVEALTEVFDGANYITNNNAVNMTELAEGMSIVGSTAASMGVEVNETTAVLGTMIASTQQSGSEMARAFRAILLNIRQVSDEEEGIDATGLTKYEKACNALGVSLKETRNGVLQTRDAMEVLKELSIEYNKLEENDIRRTELLNSVGGKLRANALDAILKNYDMYSKMLTEYEQGTGSMAREAEKTSKSLEGSLNRLSNTWTDTVENVLSSDLLKGTVELFNTLLGGINKLTDALGGLGTIGLGAGLFAGIKNVGKRRSTMFYNCFEYADRDRCSLYKIGFLSPIVKYTLVNEATISVEII